MIYSIATALTVRTILIAETLAIITSSFFLLPSSFFLLPSAIPLLAMLVVQKYQWLIHRSTQASTGV
ncbi:MAG TPA: hypothetical protein VK211_19290 [Kamptonema sp.]|nr:hypothetical protein [Kamptonema sp.]